LNLFSYPPPHGHLNDLRALKRDSANLAAAVDGFDFLVNNAAVDPIAPIEAYSIEEFLAVQTINAHAAFVLCQTLAPRMKRKSAGAIVNVMSVVLSGGWAEKVPCAMSKGALLGLTRSLPRELGPHNIRVNGAFTEENFCRDRLSAVIVFAPLAAMADSVHAGRGVSHSRHIRHSRNAQKERARAGAEHMRMMRHAPAAPKS
jgi:NAD(P)-dependent dehydrogenase (short-subunit alcohol dehydrogenase family)